MGRTVAAILAFAGGALLLFAGLANVELWVTIGEIVKPFFEDPQQRQIVTIAIQVVIFIAGLGGFAVIGGGIAMLYNKELLAKVLIFLGAATGLLGIIIGIALTLARGGTVVGYFVNQLNGFAGLAGVLLAYASRKVV